ncbi:hypothetical protein [Ectothiorhodospira variabilis]|nr:hypothetical protein [Ectothiorhodospira variabilis]MCG5504354.1 hypothetical protein [Ectothiorhodospira variabilis]
MYLSVYNAWAAALISLAGRKAKSQGFSWSAQNREPEQSGVKYDETAGLLRVAASGSVMLVGTRGQIPQTFARTILETRYAGGFPFHLRHGGKMLCPPPARVPIDDVLDHPGLASWVPVFRHKGELFALSEFDDCKVEVDESEVLKVSLVGSPLGSSGPGRDGFFRRALDAADWRFLNHRLARRALFFRARLHGLTVRVDLVIDLPRLEFVRTVKLLNQCSDAVDFLNPGGHAYLQSAKPSARAWVLRKAGASDLDGDLTLDQGEFSAVPLPSVMSGAYGSCLPSMRLQSGVIIHKLSLSWEHQ